jgi:hypothetical protein
MCRQDLPLFLFKEQESADSLGHERILLRVIQTEGRMEDLQQDESSCSIKFETGLW